MDECIPPIVRDSKWFMLPFFYVAYNRANARRMMNFKREAYLLGEDGLSTFYRELNSSISRRRITDLSEKMIKIIVHEVKLSKSVLDAGCGKGYLLSRIRETYPEIKTTGFDFSNVLLDKSIPFFEGNISNIPFRNQSYDTVICTHTLEHVLDFDKCINELKRIAHRKLIIVVPKQRNYYYTLDEHLNFFPYKELLDKQIGLTKSICDNVNGDWIYIGEL
jgi:ubiquinone/menaquinone biosynthesis C-methylase UbiE